MRGVSRKKSLRLDMNGLSRLIKAGFTNVSAQGVEFG